MLSFSAIGMPCSGPRTRALRALAVPVVGLLQSVWIYRDECNGACPRTCRCGEVERDQLVRREALFRGPFAVGDGGFDHLNGRSAPATAAAPKKSERTSRFIERSSQ